MGPLKVTDTFLLLHVHLHRDPQSTKAENYILPAVHKSLSYCFVSLCTQIVHVWVDKCVHCDLQPSLSRSRGCAAHQTWASLQRCARRLGCFTRMFQGWAMLASGRAPMISDSKLKPDCLRWNMITVQSPPPLFKKKKKFRALLNNVCGVAVDGCGTKGCK